MNTANADTNINSLSTADEAVLLRAKLADIKRI
jgi:hypothetical protein